MKSRRKKPRAIFHPNDVHFTRHLEKLVKTHGGKWAVILGGHLIGQAKNGKAGRLTDERWADKLKDTAKMQGWP